MKKIYDFVNWRGLLQSLRIEVLCSEKDNDMMRRVESKTILKKKKQRKSSFLSLSKCYFAETRFTMKQFFHSFVLCLMHMKLLDNSFLLLTL